MTLESSEPDGTEVVEALEAGADDGSAQPGDSGEPTDHDSGESQSPVEPEDPLVAAQRQAEEYLALAQRTQADFENYRKRAAKELAAAGERARGSLIRELLPVVDNLERALDAAQADDGLTDGIKLVYAELVAALERTGVSCFSPLGELFDPTLHEALSTQPSEPSESGLIVDVVEPGYRLGDTVLRPARVVVGA